MDLEWNGAYSQRANGYFNEIIEIGAVKMDDSFRQIDTFHAVIRPVVSRKLTSIVQNLTGIVDEELEVGIPFSRAVSQLRKWIADPKAVVMTWSTTDLMVMLENCRYFLREERIPFMNNYADLQAYFQLRMGTGSAQQIGLGKACELLNINGEELDMHRALDDSILSGRIFGCVFEPESFSQFVHTADSKFYERLTFKTTIINDLNSEHVKSADLRFKCEECGRQMKRVGQWRFRNRAFSAEFICRSCNRKYSARVQVKLKYDGAETSRKLIPVVDEKTGKEQDQKDSAIEHVNDTNQNAE
jgi:inhibitor of KinA sporulation pathway (predicted exonuclease)/transposase-like protein